MLLAQKREEEACIGIKIRAKTNNADENYGVTLISPKDEVFELSADDALVVVAEDER